MPLVREAWREGRLKLFGSKSRSALPEIIPAPAPEWEAGFVELRGEVTLCVRGAQELLPPNSVAPARWVRPMIATWHRVYAHAPDCVRLWSVSRDPAVIDVGTPPTTAAQGQPRKAGVGNVEIDDSELVAEGVKGIDDGDYRSARDASLSLVNRAEGGGAVVSKARRLADKIRRARKMRPR
jgi:hypothetical protein